MELAFLPAALVGCPVNESHLALPTSMILVPLALVSVTILVNFATKAMSHHLTGVTSTILFDCDDVHISKSALSNRLRCRSE